MPMKFPRNTRRRAVPPVKKSRALLLILLISIAFWLSYAVTHFGGNWNAVDGVGDIASRAKLEYKPTTDPLSVYATRNSVGSSADVPLPDPTVEAVWLPIIHPAAYDSHRIPKIIHQTLLSDDPAEMNDLISDRGAWMTSWNKQNPTHVLVLWTKAQAELFVQQSFPPRVWEAYSKMKLVVLKADLLRYLLLYKFGGIYVDTDAECLKPIDQWVKAYANATFICSPEWYVGFREHNDISMQQWTVASVKEHPILGALIDDIVFFALSTPSQYLNQKKTVVSFTGPTRFTYAIDSYLKGADGELTGESLDTIKLGEPGPWYFPQGGVLVLPMYSFNARDEGNREFEYLTGPQIESLEYVDHHYGGWKNRGWRIADDPKDSQE
ncbi:nucleotide-diphospho-sugar transferase [Chytriomyces sp. MP71]|nr:nucleotide-diphospho-sugar transferase [Chytriomyces sp. MP71]